MPNAPSLSPQALIGFQVQNFNFPSHSIVLNENRYCQNSSSNFEFSLGPDTAICRFNSSFLLHADTTDVGFKYLWSDGSTKNELSIDKDGWYWLEISNGCDGHRFRDSVFISTIEPIQGEAIMEPQNPLPGDSISLSVTPSNLQVNWYLGGEVKSGNPLKTIARTVYNSGIIGEFFDTNGCLSYDTLYPNIPDFILNMPNAFSPNGDNLNDFFGPHPEVVFDYQLEIFDRFGKRQAQLDNSPWDGGNCLQGSYTYVMWYRLQPDSELKIVRGYLSLVP
jgi:gliding motility-associated-like protein